MKIESINPFIESTVELFDTMLGTKVTRGTLAVSKSPSQPLEITALIGMTGFVRGTVVLAFPTKTAIALVGKLLDETIQIMDDTVTDGISEFVNIVAGSSKAKFTIPDGASPVVLTLPIIVRGTDYSVRSPHASVWLDVPFSSDLGDFSLRVSLETEIGD